MKYIKLMKLMYLVEREALLRWGRPVTFDNFVSMPQGPVLSQTLNLMTGEIPPGVETVWRQFISPPQGWDVSIIRESEVDELSKAEVDLVEEIFGRFGSWDRWDLVRYTHELPEWTDPNGSSIPIEYKRVLQVGGKSEQEIFEILSDLEEAALFEQLLST